jgi:hypothetical protein
MGDPRRNSGTTETKIVVEWDSLTDVSTGDSPIITYYLEWDQGSGSWTELIGLSSDYTTLTFITETPNTITPA